VDRPAQGCEVTFLTDPDMQHPEPTVGGKQPFSSYMPALEASGELELRGAAQKLATNYRAHQITVQFNTKEAFQEWLETTLSDLSHYDNIEDFVKSFNEGIDQALSLEDTLATQFSSHHADWMGLVVYPEAE
jgi:hypothetical protein